MHLKMKLLTQAMKNPASSVTDLRALLTTEKGLLSLLSEHKDIFSIATFVLEEENFNISTIYNSDVLHPIDAYNLIKRLGRAWPKVLEALKLHADRDWQGQGVNNVYKLDMEDTVGKECKCSAETTLDLTTDAAECATKQFQVKSFKFVLSYTSTVVLNTLLPA